MDSNLNLRDSTSDSQNAYKALYAAFGGFLMDGFDFTPQPMAQELCSTSEALILILAGLSLEIDVQFSAGISLNTGAGLSGGCNG